MSDDTAASVLLLLRLKAFAPSSTVASALGLPLHAVQAETARLADGGWIRHRSGMAEGWTLTAAGRRRGEELLRGELERAGTAARVESCYREFLPLNHELLSICTDWQTVAVGGDHVPNDHSDPERDAAVLARLDALHDSTGPVLARLSDALERFATYAPRLDAAHRHVRAGRTEWLAKPTVDSYHGVWFELHEHLLVTLGRERAAERPPTPVHTTSNGERT